MTYFEIAVSVLNENGDLTKQVYNKFASDFIKKYKFYNSQVFVKYILNKLDYEVGLFFLKRFETPDETVRKIFEYKIPKILKDYLVEYKLDEIKNDF